MFHSLNGSLPVFQIKLRLMFSDTWKLCEIQFSVWWITQGFFFYLFFCFVLFPNTETVNGHRDGRLSWPQQRHALRGRLRGKHQPVSVTPSATLFGDFLWMPSLLINTADIFWVFHMIVKIYLLLPNTQTYIQLLPAPCSYDLSTRIYRPNRSRAKGFFPAAVYSPLEWGLCLVGDDFSPRNEGFFVLIVKIRHVYSNIRRNIESESFLQSVFY